MSALNLASDEPATPTRTPQPGLQELAEGCLRRNPYLALKNVCCDWRGGVLVLRGCLPSYYLKQVAQEAVARLEGVQALDNQIQVVPRPPDPGGADAGKGPAVP
jgi:hypothetical protein